MGGACARGPGDATEYTAPRERRTFAVAWGKRVQSLCDRRKPRPRLEGAPRPGFDLDDPAWIDHLDQNGYAVVSGVMGASEVQHAHDLLWEFLEEAGEWRRGSPRTWSDESFRRIGMPETGICNKRGVGQSDLSWYIRTRPRVRGAFEQVWGTNDLLTSFDGINVFRPWHYGFMKTVGGWFHVDQGRGKRGKHCVQGFVSMTDQDDATGGLVVMPGSHLYHEELLSEVTHSEDFVAVAETSAFHSMPRRLVACRAGDLVLWDSRCVHCNEPAKGQPTCAKGELLRACVYVCMTPKAWAEPTVLADRRKAYDIKATTSHWPHTQVMGIGWGRGKKISFQDAPPERQALIA